MIILVSIKASVLVCCKFNSKLQEKLHSRTRELVISRKSLSAAVLHNDASVNLIWINGWCFPVNMWLYCHCPQFQYWHRVLCIIFLTTLALFLLYWPVPLWYDGSVGSDIFLSTSCQICYIVLKRSDCAMGWAVRNQILIPAGARDVYFSIASRLALELTQPPLQCYWGLFPWSKAAGAWIWPCASV
jgi:hypothetical protein